MKTHLSAGAQCVAGNNARQSR